MTDPAEQARQWRARAEEIRSVADGMNHQVARDGLLDLALKWDAMAKLADERAKRIVDTDSIN